MDRNIIKPIWELYHIDNIKDFNIDSISFNSRMAEYYKDLYSIKERKEIYKSLEWAKEKPEYDFKGIMNDFPVVNDIPFSNSQIYNYLMKFRGFMEEKEFGLLIDNRLPNNADL